MKGIKEWLRHLFAIDESRVSCICFVFMIVMGFVLFLFTKSGTVDGNMKDIIICFILSICGTNGISSINDIIQAKNQFKSLENPKENNQPNQKPQ